MKGTLLALVLGSAAPAAPGALTQAQGVAPLPVQGVHDATGEGLAFIEQEAPRRTWFLGEAVPLTLRFGLESGFLAEAVIQPFRRRLDVPVQVQAPWLTGLPEPAEDGDRSAGDPARVVFALGDGVAKASRLEDRTRDGRSFAVLQVTRDYRPPQAGELELAAPLLRLAYATRFRDDVLHGRVAEDRRDAFVRGEPLTLTILPLPQEGRPPGFSGAVGRFEVSADADSKVVELDASIRVTLRIRGDGDLQGFEAPRLDGLAGFRVLGWVEELAPTERSIVYDLAPRSEALRTVPAIAFEYFDPTPPGRYRTARTEGIPITVRPAARVAAPLAPPRAPEEGSAGGGLPAPILIAAALLLACLTILAVVRAVRARPAAVPDPLALRAPAAARAFRASLEAEGSDLAQALAEMLAGLLDCPVPAVIASDLGSRLEAAGLTRDLSLRAAALLDALLGARYGGARPPDGEQSARALVDAIETALQRQRTRAAP